MQKLQTTENHRPTIFRLIYFSTFTRAVRDSYDCDGHHNRATATQLPGPPHFCKCFGCCCAHLMQRLLALQPNVYICVGTSRDMFFLPYVAFPSHLFSYCSLPLYLLSTSASSMPFSPPALRASTVRFTPGMVAKASISARTSSEARSNGEA